MARLTALLIVLALTGSPVANAACLGWCGSHQPTSEHCHGHASEPGAAVISSADACTVWSADGAYLRDDPVAPSLAVPVIGHLPPSCAPAPAQPLSRAHAAAETPPGPLVLRL